MIYGVLLAGGTGTRMVTSKIPKQFLKLNDVPMLNHTVDKFLVSPVIDKIVVVAPAMWLSHTRDLLKDKCYADVLVCEGGSTRQESLYKALVYITENCEVSDDDIIVSHDVARPFVSLRIIEDNVKALSDYDAADTVIPAVDTIVNSENGTTITRIPDRNKMYQGQTPQSFRRVDYINVYKKCSQEYLKNVTDAARILAENGYSVALVKGEDFNIKITTEYDLRIAKFLLGDTRNDD
ncbi:IspD/TarI family cytidylyltransferase [Succinimonas sp.]|uniref:IspD/TarI family cytidylyltransferase n=1 Tax=Succinimonas sp. TaxID=1936151 RepID=UPI00386F7EB4